MIRNLCKRQNEGSRPDRIAFIILQSLLLWSIVVFGRLLRPSPLFRSRSVALSAMVGRTARVKFGTSGTFGNCVANALRGWGAGERFFSISWIGQYDLVGTKRPRPAAKRFICGASSKKLAISRRVRLLFVFKTARNFPP